MTGSMVQQAGEAQMGNTETNAAGMIAAGTSAQAPIEWDFDNDRLFRIADAMTSSGSPSTATWH